jgi:yeast amino acid transporter
MDLDTEKKTPLADVESTNPDFDAGAVEAAAENGQYRRAISPRQIHMISLGGQIGAGLFM